MSLQIWIIEDEPPARAHLARLLARVSAPLGESLQITATLASCAEARACIAANPPPDVILCDIQLSDGSALSLFQAVPAPAPILFCTAYDQFVLEALEVGGFDYLLKPVTEARLTAALRKLLELGASVARRSTREARFLVKRGADFVSVPLAEVAYFHSAHKLTMLTTSQGVESYLDESLNQIEARVRPTLEFFRASRAFLVRRAAVQGFRPGLKGRVRLSLTPPAPVDVIVSQENAAAFKAWY